MIWMMIQYIYICIFVINVYYMYTVYIYIYPPSNIKLSMSSIHGQFFPPSTCKTPTSPTPREAKELSTRGMMVTRVTKTNDPCRSVVRITQIVVCSTGNLWSLGMAWHCLAYLGWVFLFLDPVFQAFKARHFHLGPTGVQLRETCSC